MPVAVGTAAGYLSSGRLADRRRPSCHATLCSTFDRQLSWLNALLALVVALGIQVGTNYVNDYADGVRGTDEQRVGPVRLVAGEAGRPSERSRSPPLLAFGVAGVAGLVLAARVTWWFIPLGLVCGVAGWAYTGGPEAVRIPGFRRGLRLRLLRPRGHRRLGLCATRPVRGRPGRPPVLPTATTGAFALWAGVPVGLLAAALLEANNLRDIATDMVSQKKTLAVRLGRRGAGLFYCGTLMGAALAIGVLHGYRAWSLLALLAAPLAVRPGAPGAE